MAFTGNLRDDLASAGVADWHAALMPLIESRMAPDAHGDMPKWLDVLQELPALTADRPDFSADVVTLPIDGLSDTEQRALRKRLLQLAPWRKGPFDIGGVRIDSEWRSDMKWKRVQQAIRPLEGKRVLDVGCGNGYYALRMLGDGASCVIGVDPTLLYVMQFRALQHFLPRVAVHILPLRSEELPGASGAFDTVFSMGVLYHQRSPIDHLRELRGQVAPGGELLLETLVLPDKGAFARTPRDRYARMRNVWLLPTVAELIVWLQRSGFSNVQCADLTATTVDEQRTTEWMPFESLHEALDPHSPDQTIEGWPAPLRAIITAARPS